MPDTSILEGNVKSVVDAIPEFEDLDALHKAEWDGKRRSTILNAIEDEVARRASGGDEENEAPKVHVLTKNYGYVRQGRSVFYENGHELSSDEDGDEIANLYRRGAPIELKQ